MDRQRARLLLEMERQAVLRMALGRSALEGDTTILQIARDLSADVDHALAKLTSGGYGTCETCGILIPEERLEARPEARFCGAHERM